MEFIYLNSIFNCSLSSYAWDSEETNNYNDTNIGNRWGNFDEANEGCLDENSDKICDYTYSIAGSGDAIDHFPLNANYFSSSSSDTTPSNIIIQSPVNQTYYRNSIWFNLTLDEDGSWAGYSLDSASNVTLTNSSGNWNAQNTSMAQGSHTIVFYANDTSGNMNSTSVTFLVETPPPNISSYYFSQATPKEIDAFSQTDTALIITTNASVSGSVAINKYSDNPVSSLNGISTLKAAGKYVDIVADEPIRGSLTAATIKIYYTDADIASAGIDEGSMAIYYWNGVSWQNVGNTKGSDANGKFVSANVTHFSIYALFGSAIPSAPEAPSPYEGPGIIIPPTKTPEPQKPAVTPEIPTPIESAPQEIPEASIQEAPRTPTGLFALTAAQDAGIVALILAVIAAAWYIKKKYFFRKGLQSPSLSQSTPMPK